MKSVGHGFLCGKSFGRNNEERGFGIQCFEYFFGVGAIDIGNEMHLQFGVTIWFQCLINHRRPEVGTADTDIDHIGDAFAAVAPPHALSHLPGKYGHFVDYRAHAGHDIYPIDPHRTFAAIAQGDMQYRPVLGVIDFLAVEHLVAPAGNIGLFGQFHQQAHGFGSNSIFGIVQQQLAQLQGKAFESLRILRKHIAHMQMAHCFVMLPQLLTNLTMQRHVRRWRFSI
ncbi:hypothetical protein GALL_546420 [mine drainage metagenome]|uniref:Uncharacterized protein n=1 Tax=mine drainage metagenome TaxID=410659 RepID=A0A1J5NZW6_9ZZZZ